jgi:hypothetical protein
MREVAGDFRGDVTRKTRRDDHAEANVWLRLRAGPVCGSPFGLRRRRLPDSGLVSAEQAPH